MKKVLLFTAAALVMFASCRKQRVCVCTNSAGESYTETYYLTTKSNGKAYCEVEQSSNPGFTCELN
jgi:hypothetical protein